MATSAENLIKVPYVAKVDSDGKCLLRLTGPCGECEITGVASSVVLRNCFPSLGVVGHDEFRAVLLVAKLTVDRTAF